MRAISLRAKRNFDRGLPKFRELMVSIVRANRNRRQPSELRNAYPKQRSSAGIRSEALRRKWTAACRKAAHTVVARVLGARLRSGAYFVAPGGSGGTGVYWDDFNRQKTMCEMRMKIRLAGM